MNISELINTIPEATADEALLAVQTVKTNPATNTARLRCHLTREFRLLVALRNGSVVISADGRPDVTVAPSAFVSTLRREIHEIDEAMSSGRYTQSKPKIRPTNMAPPPEDMDLPTWDPVSQSWYDAEI